MCAGISSLVFLFAVGLSEYAVALAFVVAVLDVIPMIGATIGAVVVIAIGFAEDPKIGIACVIFYVIYQQVENYVIYPRVMSKSVDIPGAVTVIAALVGAALLGVVGALLAIPTAAVAYVTGIAGIRRLGSRLASLVALIEVVFGVLWAWALLGELPRPVQLLGGVLNLAGGVAVKLGERATARPDVG